MLNRVIKLFEIEKPIIQAGMIWCSGWELASAVSNSGGLGIIGAGSMYPDLLLHHIRKCKQNTKNNFAVNLPLLYPQIEEHIKIILDEKVKIVFTSAGNPKTWTGILKQNGVKVVHVVSNLKFALKAKDAGVDAIVAEGFEAGGHNGREETTTMVLIPFIRKNIDIPLIAAGGIACGKSMLAAFALGAEGVQIGSRFVATHEASAHHHFKNAIINSSEGDTRLSLKQLTPVRLLKNKFSIDVEAAELRGENTDYLQNLLGRGRAKKGMFEGDLTDGELEIGQVSAGIKEIKSAAEVTDEIWKEFISEKTKLEKLTFN
ncbi:MAG: NAD(P)H-dependent flavin oxidoreductase [Bacteroidota bacterium]|jgi:enoyl-[acyl-carrier protein] reductase II